MNAAGFLERLGFGPGDDDPRFATRIVLAVLAIYCLAYALTYPSIFVVDDELHYIRQATLLLDGEFVTQRVDAIDGSSVEYRPSTYPLGTAAYFALFIAVAGPAAAFAASCVALVLVTLLAMRWLRDEGRSPIYALLIPGFVPSMVMGRVAMSDVPSALVITCGLYLFWRGIDRAWGWWLCSGLVAGASLIFREANVFIFIPLYLGTVLRREWKAGALVVGGLVGVALRLYVSDVAFGDPFFTRTPYLFSPATLMQRVPLYALGLLVFVPGGLILSLLYRGRRRAEVCAGIALYVVVYLAQEYSTWETSPTKRLILGLRYFIPMLPLMVFAMAEAAPRSWQGLVARVDASRRALLQTAGASLLSIWICGVALASVAGHFYLDRWTASQHVIRDAIVEYTGDAVLVTNISATKKFIPEFERPFITIMRRDTTPAETEQVLERHGELMVVFLDRADSDFFRGDAERNRRFMEALAHLSPELICDIQPTDLDHLRIWRLRHPEPADPL